MASRLIAPFSVLVLIGLCASVGFAGAIATEDFEAYDVGDQLHSLSGGSGWSAAWQVPVAARRSETTIVSGELSYAAGDVAVSGGSRALQYLATEAAIEVLATRQFASQSGTLYFSFLYQSTNSDSGDFMQLGLNNTADNPRVSAIDSGGTFQVRSGTGSSALSGIDSVDGQTYLLIVRAEKTGGSTNYNDVQLFVNPMFKTGAFNTPAAHATNDSGLSAAAFAAFRKAFHDGDETYVFDELRIGDSFADVVSGVGNTFLLPTNAGNGADAYIRGGSSSTGNYGSADYMELKATSSADVVREAYFRFDLSQAPWDRFLEADLTLTVDGSAGSTDPGTVWTFDLYGLEDGFVAASGELGEDWGEGDITWDNAPGKDTSGAGPDLADVFGGAPLATFDITGTGNSGDTITISSEDFPALAAFLNSDTDGLATFILVRSTEEFDGQTVVHRIFTKEGGMAPYLTLRVPEPSTMALALLGLLGLVGCGRRRTRSAR